MRSDLTAAFLAKMASGSRYPIQLMVVHFDSSTFGDVYLSDRDVTVDSILYEGIVENWGEISTVGEERAISGTMSTTVSIWNGGDDPFSDRFLSEDPVNIFVDLYQTFDGLSQEDIAHIGEFVIQDPIEYDENSYLLKIELVTSNMRYFGQVGSLLISKKFPLALEADLNKPIDLIIGNAGTVKCLNSVRPEEVTLSGSITKYSKLIKLENTEEVDSFPTYGKLQIEDEVISFTRNSTNITATQRGASSVAIAHAAGSVALFLRDSHFIIGQGPIASVSNVRAGGKPISGYVEHLNSNPAYLSFAKHPTYRELTTIVKDDVRFDVVDRTGSNANTAFGAEYAFVESLKAYGALISKDYKTLNIKQTTTLADLGEVEYVRLSITHWSSKAHTVNASIYINGLNGAGSDGFTYIGRLSWPNENNELDIAIDPLKLDHEHEHNILGEHTHPVYSQPQVYASSPPHTHPIDAEKVKSWYQNYSLPHMFNNFRSGYYWKEWNPTWYNVAPSGYHAISMRLRIKARLVNAHIKLYAGNYFQHEWKGDTYVNVIHTFNTVHGDIYFDVRVANQDIYGDREIRWDELTLEITYALTSIGNTAVGVNTTTTDVIVDRHGTSGIKADDDVLPLTDQYRDISFDHADTYTPVITQTFDITHRRDNFDLDWFKNRSVLVKFGSNSSDASIFISYAVFEVEYRKWEVRATDEVTCNPVGYVNNSGATISNRPDSVIQYLLTEKAGLPVSKIGSVDRDVPKWDDDDIWNDPDTWVDEGQTVGVPGAAFEEASAWFNFHNYDINGVLPGNQTIKDAIQDITWQTRSKLLWQNGKAQLVILRKQQDWVIAKNLGIDDIQLKSISVRKSETKDIVNNIDIFYMINRLSESSGSESFNASVNATDLQSIKKHGERADNDMWMFHLIRNGVTANHIADYYIWLLGETSTFYSFSAYLNGFDLEKEDYIRISSASAKTIKSLPVEIKELSRQFGSGKLSSINTLKVIGQSIRYRFYVVNKTDAIVLTDSLDVNMGFEPSFGESVHISDYLLLTWNIEPKDSISINDQLDIVADYGGKIDNTLILSDELSAHLDIQLSDTLEINETLSVAQELCFGACGFGGQLSSVDGTCNLPFGAKTIHKKSQSDFVSLSDDVSIDVGVNMYEEVVISDNLVFSDGFGCPSGLGDGFGRSPFGC